MDEGRRGRRREPPSSHVIKCNNLVIIIKEERGRNSADAPLKSHLKSVNVKYHSGVGGRTLLYQFLHRSSSPFSSPLSLSRCNRRDKVYF